MGLARVPTLERGRGRPHAGASGREGGYGKSDEEEWRSIGAREAVFSRLMPHASRADRPRGSGTRGRRRSPGGWGLLVFAQVTPRSCLAMSTAEAASGAYPSAPISSA